MERSFIIAKSRTGTQHLREAGRGAAAALVGRERGLGKKVALTKNGFKKNYWNMV